jgi:hypothetical protein
MFYKRLSAKADRLDCKTKPEYEVVKTAKA